MTAEAQTVTGREYALGFETLDSEIELDSLPVEGSIPDWLAGSLVRNGPAKYEVGERRMRHWFDGLAMLHRFSFAGGSVSYANRFLRTRAYREAEKGQISYREFATDPCRSIWKRATTMFRPGFSDNCNVNLAKLGDEYIAMTETPLPVAFDPETLDALGVAYEPPGLHATAHPHFDRESGELLAYVTHFGPRSEYRLYAQRDRSHQRRIGSHRVSEPSYMHSFALTEHYLVLVTFPLVVNPLQLAFSGRPFIENYRWKPELGTTFLVFDRADGELVRECKAGPCFSFHHINAFERGSEIVIDMASYEDASIVDSLYLDRVRARGAERRRQRAAGPLPDRGRQRGGGRRGAERLGARAAPDRLRRAQRPPLPLPLRDRRPRGRRLARLRRPAAQDRRRERRGAELVRAWLIPGRAGVRPLAASPTAARTRECCCRSSSTAAAAPRSCSSSTPGR